MSQLQKRMQRIQRREGPGIGFGAAVREQPRAMLLIARAANAKEAKTALDAGADAVLIDAAGGKAGAQLDGIASDKAAIGVLSVGLDETTAAALAESGCDFVVSALDATESIAVDTERMGHVLIASEAMEDNTLRALAPLGLDALFVERDGAGVMLANQLGLVRLATFAATPLLVTVQAGTAVAELRVLRDSGVIGVVAPVGASAAQLRDLVTALKAVPAPKKSRREGSEIALVPTAAAGRHDEADDDGEEEENRVR